MEKKHFFDEAGLSALLQKLYHLNSDVLLAQVSKLENNFSEWINKQFRLTPRQATFFGQLNAQVIQFVTQQATFAIDNRLPIRLIKVNAKVMAQNSTNGDKLFMGKSSLQAAGELAVT